jgi:hypothetical protein
VPSDGPIYAHAGEYVLNRDDVAVLKRGVGGGGSSVVNVSIDARGATFEDDRALERLTDKVSRRLATRPR